MARTEPAILRSTQHDPLAERYDAIRWQSERLCTPLSDEDLLIQTAPEASPAKWHLAHTTWFFETFVLKVFAAGYTVFDDRYDALFNSYYQRLGTPYPRDKRGLLSRPGVAEILDYRTHVDHHVARLLKLADGALRTAIDARVELGLQHEQQHQELLLTDIKLNLYANPLRPAYRDDLRAPPASRPSELAWHAYPGGIHEIGHTRDGFAFDNESPCHRVFLNAFRLASRTVTNAEYLAFIADGGYRDPAWWLADGWAAVEKNGWTAPLYWEQVDGGWRQFALGGLRALDPNAPVCHVSYYEADAFATWFGKRLPTEAEWEVAARGAAVDGNLGGADYLHPIAPDPADGAPAQLFGNVWEHTASAYLPYPGFRAAADALGEYNGKFMCNQMVSRGGSCVTAADHLRASYRNFFYPDQRWQFLGIRLADDAG